MWVLYAFLAAMFAAGVAIAGKLGLQTVDSTFASTIRAVVMAGFLLVVSFALQKFTTQHLQSLSSKDILLITLSGILGALSWIFYFAALRYGPASPVVAIDRLSIVFVLLLAALFLGESLNARSLFGGALMVAGAILISLK